MTSHKNQFVCTYCNACFNQWDVEIHDCGGFVFEYLLREYDFYGNYMAGYQPPRSGLYQQTKYVMDALEAVRDKVPMLFEQDTPMFPHGRRS